MTSFCSLTLCDRFDGSTYDRTETRGNSTFGCSSFGPCTPCSYSEKSNDETYHCSNTGFRQAYRCVELGDEPSFRQTDSTRGLHESMGALRGWAGRKVAEGENSSMHDGRQIFFIYSTCVPSNNDEKLGVLGFEVSNKKLNERCLALGKNICGLLITVVKRNIDEAK
ncbi:hypothetical protein GOP47_0013346 [Adiantum capillus-veneris]|uniref:Uncharacterized protein n=1 Tax=Adiantum capillus-veneris TaxID=13818 RepID=A0A9D4ZF76_ADICA|nr:hypothetical protein GOP47_0013346 [Adiantum capillus-veneris]